MTRTILHVDMNSYFASVEQAANPFLRGKPIAVGGGTGGKTTIVAAASYEAKARGVKTAMPAWEAKRICPELIIVAGDMDKYLYTSAEILKIFREFTPLVEVFSIDEAFLDVTDVAARYLSETLWSEDEQVAAGALEIAKAIKRKIRERFKITCTIGVGPNKLLAKLAGELKKPDGLVVLKQDTFLERVKDVKASEFCGIGRKFEKYLGELGVKTIGELNAYPRIKLVKRFGVAAGEHLWEMGQGIDNSPVAIGMKHEIAKSMGHSYTLPKFTNDIEVVKTYLLRLSEQVGRRLRHEQYKGNIVHLSLGFGNFDFWGKQKKLEDYLDDGYEIYQQAEKMMDRAELNEDEYPDRRKGFRFVGVTVSGLICQIDQMSILPEKEQNKKALRAIDELNDRFGENTVQRLATLRAVMGEKVGMDSRQRNLFLK